LIGKVDSPGVVKFAGQNLIEFPKAQKFVAGKSHWQEQ